MDAFPVAWCLSLLAIILIDLLLAGHNAIVIALVARHLPARSRRLVMVWGLAGAVLIRILMTVGLVWLLQVPGLMLAGGLGLMLVAYRLLAHGGQADVHSVAAAGTFWGAMRTIVAANALMGMDNVLAVAGLADGAIDLVVLGLLVSVPMMVLGGRVMTGLLARYPGITFLGAGVLALTAARMVVHEPWHVQAYLASQPLLYWGTATAVVVLVLLAGWQAQRRQRTLQISAPQS